MSGDAVGSDEPMPGLVIDGVTVAYDSTVAVDDVSISVPTGETLAVVGPSGSGKTTLLRAVAGLEPLRSGSIHAGGVALDGLAPHRRDVGYMFQDHALFPQYDVGANVAFGLRMQQRPAEEQQRRVAELLDLVGLAGLERRAVHELSGGEAQRVALARALAPAPGLLLLDEPFGSLDRVLREQLTDEVRALLRALGQTALHVTHDQDEAFALADQVAVLQAGRLEQVGPPEDLWRRPRSPFVAEFLGHPNRWRVTIDGGRLRLGSADLGPVPPGWSGLGAGEGNDVVCPVTAVRVALDGATFQARVTACSFRQGRYIVVASTGASVVADGQAPAVGDGGPDSVVTFEHDVALVVGSAVDLAVDTSAVHRLVN